MKKFLLTLAAAATLSAFAAEKTPAPVKLAPEPGFDEIAKTLADRVPAMHLSHGDLNDSISTKAFELFLDSLDYDRSYFTAEDEAGFRARLRDLDDMVKTGDLAFAYDVFDTYKDRVRNRVAYVDGLLAKEIDTSIAEIYDWKRDKAPRVPAAEWDDLWRRKIKHQYLGKVVAKEMEKLKAAESNATASVTNAVETVAASATNTVAATTNSVAAAEEEGIPAKPPLSPSEDVRKQYQQLLSVMESHDAEFLLTLFLNSITRAYDTHTNYMSTRNEEDFDINMRLSLQGIGALLEVEEGAPTIKELVPGGPAERDGRLKPGDRILAVQQGKTGEVVDILYWPLYKSVRVIRGAKGSTVVLHVAPKSDRTGGKTVKIDLVRDEIKLEDREAKSEIREVNRPEGGKLKLGIITLPDFYADLRGRRTAKDAAIKSCAADVKKLLNSLNDEAVDGLVFDLRNNGGGSLPDCVEMTGFFIDRGPVVQVKTKENAPMPYRDPYPGALFQKPMVILINRHSASASEILAAALQDYGRAVIVGDMKTHGKGSVQSLYPLDEGNPKLGSLKITTAGFYRIDGRSTQLKGVSPDIHIPSPLDVMEVGEEYLPNVLPWSMVTPARYQRVGQLADVTAALAKRSEERRAANPKFKAAADIIARIKDKVQNTTISLNFDDRMKMAKDDEELEKYQDELMEETARTYKKDEKKEKKEDIVLDEGVLILRDLIELGGK